MINLILYTGLGLLTVAAGGLAYGIGTTYLEQYRLVDNKAVKPRNVKVKKY